MVPIGMLDPVESLQGDALLATTDGLRYVARQPILDLRGRVHGYELLFRNGTELAFHGDVEMATRTMIDNTVIFGLEALTGSLPAFVNCTADALTGPLLHVLPPSMTVLEVLETVLPTPALIAACRHLKERGFRLALADFIWRPELEPLVALADYIKIDFLQSNEADRKMLLQRLRGASVCLIAEKVETQEVYRQAVAEGFNLFQGYFFCRPVLLKNRKVPPNHLSQIKILKLMQQDPIDLRNLAHLVKRDASLTYRLLRLVNSPISAVRQEVSSIETALLVVGTETFRRIAALAVASEMLGTQSTEILRMALVRGRFCETAAPHCGLDPAEQYLAGLLSLFPAMLRITMEDLAPSLPLREEIRMALLGRYNPEGSLLNWLESHERGEWDICDAIVESNDLKPKKILRCYTDAVKWATEALNSALGGS
jgi:EAL and modified HD-GYP domain-containing signal transduction protein